MAMRAVRGDAGEQTTPSESSERVTYALTENPILYLAAWPSEKIAFPRWNTPFRGASTAGGWRKRESHLADKPFRLLFR